eukprot:jgi/Picsp_1/322/NSC_00321-R1_protein
MRWSRSISDCKVISKCMIQSQGGGPSRVWGRHHWQRQVLVEDKRAFQIWPSGVRPSSIVRSIDDGRDGAQGVVEPKFVRFTPRNSLREKLLNFERTYSVVDDNVGKTLIVRPMSNEWIENSALLLTESFAESMGYLSVYRNFLLNQIRQYLNKHVLLIPKTLILVGVLRDEESQNDVLVGTLEVSFSPSTRSTQLTLNPPPELPYLCNMAVEPTYRGQGYGSLLLDAAEDMVYETGYKSLFLHVRHVDAPALGLYRKSGFSEEGEDWPLIRLFGLDQRYLMKKSLVDKGG